MKRLPLLVLALSSLSLSASGQVMTPFGTVEVRTGKHYWGELADARFGEVIVGEFTGDDELDAVVLDDGAPLLLISPETFLTSIHAPEVVQDLALLPGPDGGRDEIATVGVSGLRRYSFDSALGSWTGETIAAGPWRSAVALACGDLEGDGDADFVGVLASNPEFACLLLDIGAGEYAVGRIRASAAIRDVVLVDWDGDGTLEVGLLTAFGIEVYTGGGALAFSYAWDVSDLLAVALTEPNGTHQRLAVVATAQGGFQQHLVVAGAEGVEGPWALGPLGVVSMAAGDLDSDADEELVLGVTSAPSVFILENLAEASGPTFDPVGAIEELAVGDPDRDPLLNEAGLGLGDFDFDGDLDLFLPLQGDATSPTEFPGEIPSAVFVLENDEDVDEELLESRILGSTHHYVDGVSLDIAVELGEPEQLLSIGPDETLALEITLWRTDDLGVATGVQPTWSGALALPFPEAQGGATPGAPLGGGGASGTGEEFVFPTSEVDLDFSTLYSLRVRQVARDTGGEIVAKGPAITAIYASAVNATQIQELLGAKTYTMSEAPPLLGGGIGDSLDAGGLTSGPEIPPFGEGGQPEE